MNQRHNQVHEVIRKGTKKVILERLHYVYKVNANGDTVLHSILKNDKLIERDLNEILIHFLNKGVDPNIKNNDEQTVLHLAVNRRLKNTIDLLIRFNINLGIVDNDGNNIAHFFIKDEYEKGEMAAFYPIMNTPQNREITEKCSVSFLEFLISKSIDFDHKNNQGESAVHLAIKYYLPHILLTLLQHSKEEDNENLIELFLDQNSKTQISGINKIDQHLGDASRYNQILNILLDRSSTAVTAVNKNSCTLISEAIRKKKKMNLIETYIKYFMNKLGDRNLRLNLFQELMSTCELWTDSDTDYFLTILSDLVKLGVNFDNETAIKKLVPAAVKAKTLRPLQFLKEIGLELNCRFDLGKNLLHLLAEQTYCENSSSELCVIINDLLIRGDCQINDTSNFGSTALNLAAACDNILMIRILIELGAEVNSSDDNMRTPLHQVLMNNGSHVVEIAELLVKNGADVNAKDSKDETPLHLAASINNAQIVRLLIEKDANVHCKDNQQQTPLHRAAMTDETGEVVEMLLTSGADVNAKDEEDNRPIHCIFMGSTPNKSVVSLQMLLKKGAYVNARNNQGISALYRAMSFGDLLKDLDSINELLKYNADINDLNVRNLVDKAMSNRCSPLLLHLIKLKAANLPLLGKYETHASTPYCTGYLDDCLAEIKKLKNTVIINQHSLYDFLHMDPERRGAYVDNETLKKFIESPSFEEQFPEYSVLVLASYCEAKIHETKREVLIAMIEIFEIYNVSVRNVAEKIVNYLDNEDLYVISVPL